MAAKKQAENKELTMWEILDKLTQEHPDDSTVSICPLSNILRMQRDKKGVQVTIGVGGTVTINDLINGKYVGGLLLVDKVRYRAMRIKLEEMKKS